MRQHDESRDHGQAVPVLIGVVAVLAAIALGIGRFGGHLTEAAQARTAADAAALAGVEGGARAAAALAAANHATLVSFTAEGDDVLVTVTVGQARATARATGGP